MSEHTKTPWIMPDWMKPYLPYIQGNTSMERQTPEDIERLQNGEADVFSNAPLALIQMGVNAQIGILIALHEAGKLAAVNSHARLVEFKNAVAKVVKGMSFLMEYEETEGYEIYLGQLESALAEAEGVA